MLHELEQGQVVFVCLALEPTDQFQHVEPARLRRPLLERVKQVPLVLNGAEQVIEYLGESDDVRDAIEQADCIVLPSYREGLPRSLLESSAMATPMSKALTVPFMTVTFVRFNRKTPALSLTAAVPKMR